VLLFSVMMAVPLYAHYSTDDAVSSQFKLPSAVTAEDFDSNYYRRLLEKSEEDF